MMRLDSLAPSQVRKVRLYSESFFGCSISLAAFQDGKRWIVRLAMAKAGRIAPHMRIDPETIEAIDGILCEMPISDRRFQKFAGRVLHCGVEDWKRNYSGNLDENRWRMQVEGDAGEIIVSEGKGAYPFEFLSMIQAWDDLIYLNSCMQCMAMEPDDFKRYALAV